MSTLLAVTFNADRFHIEFEGYGKRIWNRELGLDQALGFSAAERLQAMSSDEFSARLSWDDGRVEQVRILNCLKTCGPLVPGEADGNTLEGISAPEAATTVSGVGELQTTEAVSCKRAFSRPFCNYLVSHREGGELVVFGPKYDKIDLTKVGFVRVGLYDYPLFIDGEHTALKEGEEMIENFGTENPETYAESGVTLAYNGRRERFRLYQKPWYFDGARVDYYDLLIIWKFDVMLRLSGMAGEDVVLEEIAGRLFISSDQRKSILNNLSVNEYVETLFELFSADGRGILMQNASRDLGYLCSEHTNEACFVLACAYHVCYVLGLDEAHLPSVLAEGVNHKFFVLDKGVWVGVTASKLAKPVTLQLADVSGPKSFRIWRETLGKEIVDGHLILGHDTDNVDETLPDHYICVKAEGGRIFTTYDPYPATGSQPGVDVTERLLKPEAFLLRIVS